MGGCSAVKQCSPAFRGSGVTTRPTANLLAIAGKEPVVMVQRRPNSTDCGGIRT